MDQMEGERGSTRPTEAVKPIIAPRGFHSSTSSSTSSSSYCSTATYYLFILIRTLPTFTALFFNCYFSSSHYLLSA